MNEQTEQNKVPTETVAERLTKGMHLVASSRSPEESAKWCYRVAEALPLVGGGALNDVFASPLVTPAQHWAQGIELGLALATLAYRNGSMD